MSNTNSETGPVERFARRAFEEEIERIDAPTRMRLAAARRGAIESMSTDRRPVFLRLGAPAWAVAGCAAALVLALAVALRHGDDASPGADAPRVATDRRGAARPEEEINSIGSSDALVSPADLELLAGGEPYVLDVLEEDLEFYAWLEQQPELAAGGRGRER